MSGPELRVVLDAEASLAVEEMISILKSEMSALHIRKHQFVSFIVLNFMEAYFNKDKEVLIAEFFDSDAFHEGERQKAKGNDNYEELLEESIKLARKIRSKRRRLTSRASSAAIPQEPTE